MTAASSSSNGEPSSSSSNAIPPSASTSAKPAKRKTDKARDSPSTADIADANGGKPLARAVLVCKRCRSKKIKCDQAFPACGSCVKAGEPCVGIDSATGREVSRSYIVDLEHQIAELKAQNAELERQLAKQPAPRPSEATSLGLKRPLQHVKNEFPLDPSESADLPESRPSKRPALSPHGDRDAGSSSHLLPGLVLGPAGVEVMSSKPNEPLIGGGRPSLGRLNSHTSGLSPARLLCQAIQQSAQAGLRIRDPGSKARSRRSGAQNLGEDLSRRAKNNSSKEPLTRDREDREGADAPIAKDARPGSPPQSGSATPSDSKKNSPFDDGDPMQYATATETADITVPAPEQLLKPSPLPAPFPPLSTARKLIDAYFERVNPQLPILDRASFMVRFEKACRIGLERARAKLTPERRRESENDDDKITIELQPADGHLFHLVFAIAAAMGWTRSSWSAENHHEAAMRFLDPRRLAGSGHEGNVGAIMGRDALEQLQCLLLTALYSIMRPMKPGVWYCLGVALRLTTGIGLYTETPGVLEAMGGAAQDGSETLIEKKRRLFWCSYALDRQVCVHLGRPFGIADSDIKVNLPWVDSENDVEHVAIGNEEGSAGRGDNGDDDVDSSTEFARREAASTLAALQSSTSSQLPTLPKPKDASRWVSLSFFRMRILQSEIQSILYQNAELPRSFDTYSHWKTDILRRLHAWRRYAPSSKAELEANGCGYNPIFLELNYQQTLLMIYGLSPRIPNASRKDLAHVEECSRSIINMYATLSKEGQMNYTWMTGHNVFIACTSYLYAIWQISATDPASFRSSVTLGFRNKADEIHHFAAACDKVLSSLQWATAEKCRKCLRTMFYATSVVVEKIDRMSSARTSGEARLDVTSGQPSEGAKVAGNEAIPSHSQAHTASNTHAQTSSASKRSGPTSAPSPSWALYSQDRDWRRPLSSCAAEAGIASPQRDSSSHAQQRWNQNVWDSSGYPSERTQLAPSTSDAYAGSTSDATTPSRGLDMGGGGALVDAANSNAGWYAFAGSEISPKLIFPDSPSNLDIQSLMATSAMELDALFREAGLATGPSGEQQGGSMGPSLGAGAGQQQQVGQGEMVGAGFYDAMGGGGVEGRKWTLASQIDGASGEQHQQQQVGASGGGGFAMDSEGFETDWEALGFGYRMSAQTQYGQNMPIFGDHANQQPHHPHHQQQQQRTGFAPPLGMHPPSSHNARPATEFDHRFLDSHMGF